jgi:hypothetical protein
VLTSCDFRVEKSIDFTHLQRLFCREIRRVQNRLSANLPQTIGRSVLAKFVGVTPFASVDRSGLGMLRTALVSGVALVLLAGLAVPADAATRRMGYGNGYGGYGIYGFASPADVPARRVARRGGSAVTHDKAEPKKDPGFGEMPKGPQQIIVNISTQKVTLYSNGARVAQGPVATGMPGHPTPQGVFSIIEKDRYHHSNIYSGAPMPYMQRITWSGVALHEGPLPGYPASHGCIRMSHDFAMKLWPITKLGVRVIVTRHDVEPVEFAHAKLFVPKEKPAEPQVAVTGATDGVSIKVAQVTPAATSDATDATPEVPAAKPATGAAEEPKAAEIKAEPPETVKPSDDLKAAESVQPAPAEPLETVTPAEGVKAAEQAPPAEPADEVLKATGTVAPAQPAAVPAPIAPSDLRKSVETPAAPPKAVEVAPAAAQPSPAEATPANDVVKPAPTIDPPKPAAPRTKAAEQPAKRTGQVAVFVSRKEKKIFVRQGMVPLFDMPITFDNPDQPLGTHVFTAMTVTDNGAGMRWNLMTIPTDTVAMMEDRGSGRRKSKEPAKPVVHVQTKSSTAAEALDRIQFPKEAVDRISELLTPGSSLVVSDTGLGSETGRFTDFIVLTR